MEKSLQESEAFELGAILAMAGGFMDAYSYMCRGQVFANAQTGNILLLGVNLAQLRFGAALSYFTPVAAFACGIVFANVARGFLKNIKAIHWRQVMLAVEILLFLRVGFFPQTMNGMATTLISAACGIQLETFRTVCGNSAATTMCIGNLRSMTNAFCDYLRSKNKNSLRKALLFGGVIACFAIGAILGDLFVRLLAQRAIWVCNLFLLGGFGLMFIDKEAGALSFSGSVRR